MNQLTFPNLEPLARSTDPVTSHLSAARFTASRRQSQKSRILAAVEALPLHTSAEIAAKTGIDRYVVARRLPDLRTDGKVRNRGSRVCTQTGERALVWERV